MVDLIHGQPPLGQPPIGQVEKAQRRVRLAMIAIGGLALAAVAVVVLLLIPYNPVTVVSYTPAESEVCVRAPVEVVIQYEIEDGMKISTIEAESSWTAIEVPEITDGQEVGGLRGVLAPTGTESGRVTSTLGRIAPTNAGVWQLRSEISVHGTRYGVPHVQKIETWSPYTTTVLSKDDAKCSGE